MKIFIALLVSILFPMKGMALSIQQINLSAQVAGQLQIGMLTTADELYYYQSFDYAVYENMIALNVYFVSGFGSTIASLNNTFNIPIDTAAIAQYQLIVRAFYNNPNTTPDLQDSIKLQFSTPILGTIYLPAVQLQKRDYVLWPNPSSGEVNIPFLTSLVTIYDSRARVVEKFDHVSRQIWLSNLENGLYFIEIESHDFYCIKKLIIKK